MTTAIAESGATFLLTIRSERPVEGCELIPNAFLQLKGGTLDNNTRAKLLEAVNYRFTYTWSRGPRTPICSNSSCSRGQNFDPVSWSRAFSTGPAIVCGVCERARAPSYESSFCSVSCFKNAWKVHSQKHAMLCSKKRFEDNDAVLDEVELEETEDIYGKETSRSTGSWVFIRSDDEKVYTPSNLDVGCCLKVEVRAVSTSDNTVLAGPVVAFTEPVLSAPYAPPKRSLATIPGAVHGISGSVRFRILSYNILAELYATKQAFPYCDSWSLAWPYRKAMLLVELENMQADVICLQEVQMDHYEAHILPYMNELGYDAVYKQKSRESMGLYGKVDGCATFWRRSKFVLLSHMAIEFNDIARQEASNLGLDESESRKFMNRLSRDNVAQVVLLESVARVRIGLAVAAHGSQLCVVNTHLYSNQQRADVKLWQALNLMWALQPLLYNSEAALIICGDYNSTPDSAVYEFMATGGLEGPKEAYPELMTEQGHLRILPNKMRDIRHTFELASGMCAGGEEREEPLFTNYTAKFKGTLDYIFYSPSRLRVTAITPIPDELDLRRLAGEGLPSACYPSDHLLLCCDFALLTGVDTVGGGAAEQQQQATSTGPRSANTSFAGVLMSGGGGGGGAAAALSQSQQSTTQLHRSTTSNGFGVAASAVGTGQQGVRVQPGQHNGNSGGVSFSSLHRSSSFHNK